MPQPRAWAQLWQNAVSTEFLAGYRQAIAANPDLLPRPRRRTVLLNAYLLEKALYELSTSSTTGPPGCASRLPAFFPCFIKR